MKIFTKNLSKIFFLILFTLSFFFCFFELGRLDLVRWDEETNAQVISENLNSDNPFFLTLNKKPFWEKPPLWYYLTTLTCKLIGFNNFSLRFISALSGFLLILFIYKIGKEIYHEKVGLIAGFLFLLTPQFFIFDPDGIFASHHIRSADLDLLQILFMTISVYSFYCLKAKNSKWIYAGFLFSALALMTKGPLGLLPIIISLPLLYHSYQKQKITLKQIFIALLIFLSLTLPWHLGMFLKFKNAFLNEYFIYHLLKRGAIALEGHVEPWYFYLKLLFNRHFFLIPEIIVLSIIQTVFKRKEILKFPTNYFLIFALSFLLIITLTRTKLAWYLLPIYPFLNLYLAQNIDYLLKKIQK